MQHRSGVRAFLCLLAAALAGCGSTPKKLLWVRFRFEGDELVLEDPGIDSRIRLARVKGE